MSGATACSTSAISIWRVLSAAREPSNTISRPLPPHPIVVHAWLPSHDWTIRDDSAKSAASTPRVVFLRPRDKAIIVWALLDCHLRVKPRCRRSAARPVPALLEAPELL